MPGRRQNIFYQLATGDIPSKTVYEDENVRGILDTKPATSGHVLILPKKEIQVSPQLDEPSAESVSKAIKTISERALKGFDIGGTTVFIANGGVAGQKAPHLLVHLIPRSEGDGIGLKPKPKKIPEREYEDVKNKLMSAFGKEPSTESRRNQAGSTSESEEDIDFERIERMFK